VTSVTLEDGERSVQFKNSGKLTITGIETIPVRVDLSRTYRGSHYRMPRRCTIITRVLTAEGVVGECYNADWDDEQAEILRIIHDEIAPLVAGADAIATERCWFEMYRVTLDQLRDRRLATQAVACVDSAIWDAVGKALETPLYRLWGGYRDEMPIIAIGGYYVDEPNWIEKEVMFFAEQGFAGMKFKIGGRSPEEDLLRLNLAVRTAPDDFLFMVDANQAWTVDEAVRFVRMASEFVQIRWFEEPCRWPNDGWNMATVRQRVGVPVAAGQSEISAIAMRDLMAGRAIDVSNFDASWGGGPTEWRRVAALAASYGVELGHHEEAQISSHLLASVPHGTFVEAFAPERDPIYWEMLANRPTIVDGKISLPSGPGFGWELDQRFVERYRGDR
jgi:D-galactarolactone cycloisomerase